MFIDIDRKKQRRRWFFRNLFWLLVLGGTGFVAFHFFVPFIKILDQDSVQTEQQSSAPLAQMTKETQEYLNKNKPYWFVPGTMADPHGIVKDISKVPAQGGWINTSPIDVNYLRNSGYYTLIYFWSSSSLGCARTNLYVEWVWREFKDHGLLVIGIHSPQFAAESDPREVLQQVEKQKLTFPILLDGDRTLWNKFSSYNVPTQYLLNPAGKVVYSYVGEGDYTNETQVIRDRLTQAGWLLDTHKPLPLWNNDTTERATPALYAGYHHQRRIFGNDNQGARNKVAAFTLGKMIQPDTLNFNGQWLLTADYMESKTNGDIVVNFAGEKAFAYLEAAGEPVSIHVTINSAAAGITQSDAGVSQQNNQRQITVDSTAKLYELTSTSLAQGQPHEIRIAVPKGLRFYVMTFDGK